MLNRLRTALRKWLGVEDWEKSHADTVSGVLRLIGMGSGNGSGSIVHRIESLNNAIVNQEKSFRKQIGQFGDNLCLRLDETEADWVRRIEPIEAAISRLESSNSLQRELNGIHTKILNDLKNPKRKPVKKKARP